MARALAGETPLTVEVETLLEQGEPKAALTLLERTRKDALSGEDLASLDEVLAGTRFVYAQADPKYRNQADRIANATRQNIRFLTRKQALAAGDEWVDPFQAPAHERAAAGATGSEPDRRSQDLLAGVAGAMLIGAWVTAYFAPSSPVAFIPLAISAAAVAGRVLAGRDTDGRKVLVAAVAGVSWALFGLVVTLLIAFSNSPSPY
jgi:hypothetical protein